MGEHLLCTQRVAGSSPTISTNRQATCRVTLEDWSNKVKQSLQDVFRYQNTTGTEQKCLSPLDEPCKDCWKAIFHSGNIDEVRLDDIVFYPADKERFLTLEKMVKKYKDQFAAMKADAKAHGISIEELCKQFANRRTIEVWIDGIQ